MAVIASRALFVLLLSSSLAAVGCGGDDDPGMGGDSSVPGRDGGPGVDGGPGTDGGPPGGCDPLTATPPWPDFVPDWPGSGRNASGRTAYVMLEDGATVEGLRVERVTATSAIIRWTTAGDASSAVAWGTSPDVCPAGYQRTGARRDHRMAIGPLEPGTEYHVTAQSDDGSSASVASITLTTESTGAATVLTDCGTISEPGDYRLTADVTADCTCFEITGTDVRLDLGFHRVTYAETSTAEQCHGVQVRGDGAEVARGTIQQGSAGGDSYSHGVAIRSVNGATVEQLFIHVVGSDANGLRSMFSGAVSVRDVIVVSGVREVLDRHYPGNRGIALDLTDDGAGEVEDCILFGVPHWGIYMTGGDRLDSRPAGGQTRVIRNNHVFADMHATNGYGLGVHANHVEVAHNEIRPLHNGRAIHYTGSNADIHHNIVEAVELVDGDPAEGYAYYSDTADPSSPHDPSVCTWVVAHGIRIESGNYGVVHHNEVVSYSLPTVSFGATGLNISTSDGARGGNEVHDNQFTTLMAEGSRDCSGGLPMVAGWVRGAAPTEPANLHDNRFVSDGDTLLIEDPALATSTDDELVGP